MISNVEFRFVFLCNTAHTTCIQYLITLSVALIGHIVMELLGKFRVDVKSS